VLAALDRERDVLEQDAIADPDLDVLRLHDGSPAARRLQKLESEPLVPPRQQVDLVLRLRLLLLEAADLRQLRLSLPRHLGSGRAKA